MTYSTLSRRSALHLSLITFFLISTAALQAQPSLVRGQGRPVTPGPHARSAQEVDIDGSVLSNGPSRLWLDVPGRPSALAEADDFERRGNGGVVWRGKLQSDSNSQVVITRHKGVVVGTIWTDDKVYEIRPGRGGRSIVTELDPASFPPCSDSPDLPPGAAADAGGGLAGGQTAIAKDADPGAEMHLLSVYTPQARDAEGGVAEIEALIQAAVDNANTALINSNMIGRYVLVHTALANYNDSGNLSTDLDWVDSNAAVAALRNQYGADMVSLVVNSGGCGIGYVQRNPGPGFASAAFQVTVRDCAVGNLTLAHEHGHNLGMEHDPANGPSSSVASYPWSFGYFIGGNVARTVMAYPSPCGNCPRVMHFSNPDVTYNGLVTGVENVYDNARTGDLTAPIVHNFRAAVYVGGSSSQSFQDGVSPTTGYAGTTDTYLSQISPNSNLGSSTELRSDGDTGSGLDDRTVLRWDLTQIPAGALVKSVRVNITVNNSSGDTYYLYALSRPWDESQVTWNQAASGVPWQIAGASGPLDRDGTLLGMIPVTANGTIGATLNASGIAAVQSWVNSPATNAGLIVIATGGSDGVYFRSSEYGVAGERPQLTVSYDPPAANTAPQFGVDPILKSDAQQDGAYSDSIAGSATDADFDPLTYGKVSGPAWLAVAGNGGLSGTPTSADLGLNHFTVSVSDGRGGSDTATLTIDVVAPPTLSSITVSPSSASIAAGATQAFTATGHYSDLSTQNLTGSAVWASSNTAAATMSGAVATGVAAGSANITAALGGITSSAASLTVTQPATLTSITVAPSSASITVGATQAFTATGHYSDASTQNLTGSAIWASSNTAVATMSGNIATGVGAGSSNVTASLGGVTSAPASLTVTVFSVTGMLPNLIRAGVSSPVTISGSGFVAGAALLFQNGSGSTPSVSNIVVSSNQITANLFVATNGPKRDRHWDVIVQNGGGGQTGAVPGGLTVTLNAIPNNPPSVAITSPGNGSSFAEGVSINFTGTANDVEQGNLTSSLNWSSSLDGPIGGGGNFSVVLSAGNHTITASVTDSGGLSGSSAISITVGTPNTAPQVTITSPSSGSSFTEGTNISFSATATDNEDGNVAASLVWSSNLQGNIGSGASFSAVLNPGTHTITATASDSKSLTGGASISVTVNSSSPALTITGISPNPVSRNAGTLNFTISGTGFVNGATVGFENGTGQSPVVNSVTWISPTQISANVQIRSGGPSRVRYWDVRVTNPNNATAVSPGLLQINP